MTLVLLRLKQRAEFLRVASFRRKWVTPGLVLQAVPALAERPQAIGEAGGEAVGVGFTVTRKVGNAVKRNRARRRLRAVAAEVLPGQARPGFDLVLIGRGETLDRPYRDLVEDLRNALRRLGALRPEDSGGEGREGRGG